MVVGRTLWDFAFEVIRTPGFGLFLIALLIFIELILNNQIVYGILRIDRDRVQLQRTGLGAPPSHQSSGEEVILIC